MTKYALISLFQLYLLLIGHISKASEPVLVVDKPILTASNTILCNYGEVVNFTVPNCPGTINWQLTSGSSNSWNLQVGQTRSSYIFTDSGFFVSCTDNGVTSVNSDTIFIKKRTVTIKSEDLFICNGGSVLLEAVYFPTTGIDSIQWKYFNTNIPGATSNVYNAQSFNDPNQNYTVKFYYNNGCVITSPEIRLDNTGVLTKPIISATKSSISGPAYKVFDKRFGGNNDDAITDIIKTPQNELILGGYTLSSPNNIDLTRPSRGFIDYLIIKTDSAGNKIWDKRFGGSNEDNLKKIMNTSNGDILLFGNSTSGVSGDKTSPVISGPNGLISDIWVVKVNAAGLKIWDKKYGGNEADYIIDVYSLPNNEFIMAGITASGVSGSVSEPSRGSNDYWICKIDSSGTKIWDKRFGGSGGDILTKIIKTTDNGFILAGSSNSPISGDKTAGQLNTSDIWLVKINSLGQKIWDKRVNYPGSSGTYNMDDTEIDTYGNLHLLVKDNSQGNWLYSKTDSLGNLIFTSYNPIPELKKIRINNLGAQLIGNASFLPPTYSSVLRGQSDGIIIQYDSLGLRLWDKNFGGTSGDNFTSFVVVGEDLVLAGSSASSISFDKSQSNRGLTDFWIVKTKLKESLNAPIGVNPGQSIDLIVNNCPGRVSWSTNPIVNGQVLKVSPQPGNTITANCTAFGCTSSDSTTIIPNCSSNFNVTVKNNAGTVVANPTICIDNTTFTLKASGCTGTITWSTGATIDSIVVSPTTASTYSVTCSGTLCASISKSIKIKNFDTPLVFNQGLASFCNGDSTYLKLDGGTYPGHIFEWYRDNVLIPNSQMKILLNVKESGAYKVKLIKDQCYTFSSILNVNVKPIPSAPTFSSPEYYTCTNLPVQVTAIGCTETTNWPIQFGNGTTKSLFCNNSAGFVYYNVKCILNGCSSSNSTVKISNPTTFIQGESSRYICNTEIATLINVTPAPSTIKWYKNNVVLPNETSSSLNVNSSGYYKSEILLTNSCIFTSRPVEVIKNDTILNPISGSVDSLSTERQVLKVWDKTFGSNISSFARDIIKTSDDNFLIIGISYGGISGNKTVNTKGLEDVYIVKVDSLGNKIWDKSIGTNWVDLGYSAVLTNDGNILIVASSLTGTGGDKTNPPLGDFDVWLIKIDNNGNKIWDKSYGSSGFEDYPVLIKSNDNNYLLGYQKKLFLNGNSFTQFVINKLNENGDIIWAKVFNAGGQNKITSMVKTSDGGYLIAAESTTTQTNLDRSGPIFGNQDIWLIKTDSLGNKVWDKSFGGNQDENNPLVYEGSDANIIIVSSSNSGVSGNKTTPNLGSNDFWIIKTNSNGVKLWEKNYGGSSGDYVVDISIKQNGNIVLIGGTNSPKSIDILENSYGSSDGIIFEIQYSNGEKVLQKRFGGTSSESINNVLIQNDSYLMIGTSESLRSGNKLSNLYGSSDYWLINAKLTKPAVNTGTVDILPNQGVVLNTSDCLGFISWSNGQTGSNISVSPIVNTTYIASCSFGGCIKKSEILVRVATCGFYTSLTQVTDNIISGTSNAPVIKRAFKQINANNLIGNNIVNGAGKYISGNSILLNPGFKVEVGSIFQTKISNDPCNE